MKQTVLIFTLLGSLAALPVLADTGTPDATSTTPPQYKFVASSDDTELGPEGLVEFVDAAGKKTPVVEILRSNGGLSPLDRANKIADRLQSYAASNPHFLDALLPKHDRSEVVIVNNEGTNTFPVVTADKNSAVQAGMKTDQYAAFILKSIEGALSGKLRDAKFDWQLTTDDEKIERANQYRLQAQEAYTAKDMDLAEAQYLQATKVAPDYAVPYLALANFYLAQGNTDAAKAILKKGLDNHADLTSVNSDLDPVGGQKIQGLISQIQAGS